MEPNKQIQKLETGKSYLEAVDATYMADISELQSYLPKDNKDKIDKLSNDAKTEIVKSSRRMTSGIRSSIPMVCKANKCCMAKTCTLLKNDVAPLGYLCPYEEFMVDKLTSEYYVTLAVDPFNRTERDLIKQMVEMIIIDNRTSADIANDGLYMDQIVGADNKGKPLISKVESLAYSIKLKTQARIDKLQNELLATRKIKKQLNVGGHDDPSSRSSNLIERFRELKGTKIEDVKVEIINDGPKGTTTEQKTIQ